MTNQPFERLATNHFLKLMAPVVAAVMDHPVRRRLNDPVKTLGAAGLQAGQYVLEVGCGTGFFTGNRTTKLRLKPTSLAKRDS